MVGRLPLVGLPTGPSQSEEICGRHLPREHKLPAFFRIRDEVKGDDVGAGELRAAYDRVHGDYDEFWLSAAAPPVDDLVRRLSWRGDENVFEAGCGTGYGTALLARRAARVVAADLSAAMLGEARARLAAAGLTNVRFVVGDAIAALAEGGPFDRVFTSWVLGYIPLEAFFRAAARALGHDGRLAFIVHKENSPREELEIFAELVAEAPTALRKRVAFDFPRDLDQVRRLLRGAGLRVEELWEDVAVFRYGSAEEVLEHLLKSGAGTAFYDAIDPAQRDPLTRRFLEKLTARRGAAREFTVRHDYVACIAAKD